MRASNIIAGLVGAVLIGNAPAIASASPDDLTNAGVRSTTTPSPKFVPYKVVVPVPDTGGQGPNYGYSFGPNGLEYGTDSVAAPFDDGLSGSSREALKVATAP